MSTEMLTEQQPFSQGIEELRHILQNKPVLLFLDQAIDLIREDFQSTTFRKAGYHMRPEMYPIQFDRSLWILTSKEGPKWIIANGKISQPSDGPYTVWGAEIGGMDLRQVFTAVVKWESGTITTYDSKGNHEDTFGGEFGKLEKYLETARNSLGLQVRNTKFI